MTGKPTPNLLYRPFSFLPLHLKINKTQNPISELEQRRGAATLPKGEMKEFASIADLRKQVIEQDQKVSQEQYQQSGFCVAETYQKPANYI